MTAGAVPGPVTIVGFGQLGEALTPLVAAAGRDAPRVHTRPRATAEGAAALHSRIRDAGGQPCARLDSALDGARLVLACVPAGAAGSLAAAATRHLAAGCVWADLSSSFPADKQRAADLIEEAGGRYVDAAVLGAVAVSGGRVPVLACGRGAPDLLAWAPALGLQVAGIDGPPGTAARVKLLRSVYLKGRDALVAEMMDAAERHGLAEVVVGSISGPGEEVPFPALVERILSSLSRHAPRRADELRDSASLLRETGVQPLATEGAERRLRQVAADRREPGRTR